MRLGLVSNNIQKPIHSESLKLYILKMSTSVKERHLHANDCVDEEQHCNEKCDVRQSLQTTVDVSLPARLNGICIGGRRRSVP